jgi:cell division protease FtsH
MLLMHTWMHTIHLQIVTTSQAAMRYSSEHTHDNDDEEEEEPPPTRPPPNRTSFSEWLIQLKQWLSSSSSSTVISASMLLLGMALIRKYWLYHLCLQKNGKKQIAASSVIRVTPLSVLLNAARQGRLLQKSLIGTSSIVFQEEDDQQQGIINNKRVLLPKHPALIVRDIFASSDFIASLGTVLLAALPFVYLGIMYRYVLRGDQLGEKAATKKNIYKQNCENRVTFRDVAGIDDDTLQDVTEIVQFLRHPRRYQHLGAAPSRGILLHGPPGTGKTLLAQAVAGEANVDCFVATCASDFVELYVGRGASRVRNLFQTTREEALQNYNQRKRQAQWRKWLHNYLPPWIATSCTSVDKDAKEIPCCAIIFIDELDALAKARSSFGGSNDEREQTLNQFLTEMDGFRNRNYTTDDDPVTIIVMAATNRADILDPAILRRFDRQIRIGYPDASGREAILRVHARRIRTMEEENKNNQSKQENSLNLCTNWERLARDEFTGGFTGAELRNLINEAALLAVREGLHDVVKQTHLERAARKIRLMKNSLKTDATFSPFGQDMFPDSL